MEKNKSVEFLCYYNIIERINPNIIKCEIYYDMLTDRCLFYINSRLLSNDELRINFVPYEDVDKIRRAKKEFLRNKKLEQILNENSFREKCDRATRRIIRILRNKKIRTNIIR